MKVTTSTVLNNYSAGYGAIAVAAMGISYKNFTVTSQIALGFSQGIMPLVSYNYASGNRKRMKKAIIHTISIVFPIMLCLTAVYWIFSRQLILTFIQEPDKVNRKGRFL